MVEEVIVFKRIYHYTGLWSQCSGWAYYGKISGIKMQKGEKGKHTTASIRWSSPTQLLISRFEACQYGRADGMQSSLQSMAVCKEKCSKKQYNLSFQKLLCKR